MERIPSKHDDGARTALFWSNLQAAMLAIGASRLGADIIGKPMDVDGWVDRARKEFAGRKWTGEQQIFRDHVIRIAKADSHFTLADGVITMTRDLECKH